MRQLFVGVPDLAQHAHAGGGLEEVKVARADRQVGDRDRGTLFGSGRPTLEADLLRRSDPTTAVVRHAQGGERLLVEQDGPCFVVGRDVADAPAAAVGSCAPYKEVRGATEQREGDPAEGCLLCAHPILPMDAVR